MTFCTSRLLRTWRGDRLDQVERRASGARTRGQVWLVSLILMVALGELASPSQARAEADTLSFGDVSIALFQSVEPFNRYWYHYQQCKGNIPCSRFDLNTYDSIDVPPYKPEIPFTRLDVTGLRAEYGLLPRLTIGSEVTYIHSNRLEPSSALGDSSFLARWRLTTDGGYAVSLATKLKLPGSYDPAQFGAPGGGQTDLEFATLFGGLAARRKFFYDVGFGYRVRFNYRNPVTLVATPVSYADAEDTEGTQDTDHSESYTITGPADQVFLDVALGYYTTRRVLLFLNAEMVNSTKGIHLDDYFRVTTSDDQDRAGYDFTCDPNCADPDNLLTILEEDYFRLGGGVLFKAFASTTIYVNYSYILLGQNTPAAYVIPNTRIPIGGFAIGVEYTFGTRKLPESHRADRGTPPRDTVLSKRLTP